MRLVPLFLILFLALPASAAEITAPEAPGSASDLMPDRATTFGEGLLEILHDAVGALRPDLAEASAVCLSLLVIVLLISIVKNFPGYSGKITDFVGAVGISSVLLHSTNSLVHLGTDSISELSEYGKLLLPVMTSALAAQGGITSSAALYAGTAIFSTVLCTAITKLLIPMIYIFLALACANSAIGEDILRKMASFVKWLMTWCLKTILYVFTGYIGITGVVSGTTDASALKAAKLTISGVVPVVGGILADASEAVLVSAGVVKNTAGIYGIFAIIAVFIGPFLQIGTHYLLLKVTAAVCGVFGSRQCTELIADFSAAMGLLLGMAGSVCLLLLISTVCFLKGVG